MDPTPVPTSIQEEIKQLEKTFKMGQEDVLFGVYGEPSYENPLSSVELQNIQRETNVEAAKRFQMEKIYNLSILDIFRNTRKTVNNILNDLLFFRGSNVQSFVQIFFKEDRPLYLGIFLILCVMFYLIVNLFEL